MAGSFTISNTFATQTGPIPLSQLDTNFSSLATVINSTSTFSNYYVDSSGSANSIVVTISSPTQFSYVAGQTLQVKVANTVTGATTINVNGIGAKSVVTTAGGALTSGVIVAGSVVSLTYDGTNFQLQNAISSGGTVSSVSGTGTVNGITLTGTVTTTGSLTLGGTLSGIGNSQLTNSSVTIGSTSVALGATVTTFSGVTLTSPTLTTPALGTPASGTLSNCTVDGTNGVGYINVPQNSQTVSYTAVAGDAGKHILMNGTSLTATIPANGSVPYAVGTVLTFVNSNSTSLTIAITTDTMYLAGSGTTGSRTLAQYGIATAIKTGTTSWLISGVGLS